MKTFIYFAAVALLSIGFSACEKESDLIELENSETFFEYQSKHEVHLSTVIELLKEKNDSIPFIQEFKNLYGRAMWDENITVENSDGFVILVPILSNDKSILNGIWMFNRYDNLMNYGVILNDEDVRKNLLLDHSFAYFEQTILGLNEKYKFEDVKNENNLTKNASITEHCNIIFAGNDNVGWEFKGIHCWNTYSPGSDTNVHLYNDFVDHVGGGTVGGMGGANDGGANDGGGNDTGNPTPDPSPKVDEDPSFKENPCASAILFSLKTGQSAYKYDETTSKFIPDNNLTESILKFFENSTKFNITYSIGSLSSDVAGRCHEIDQKPGSYIITLNEPYAKKATDLAIARTLIHETIHAHLGYITNGLSPSARLKSNEWHALNEIYNNIPYKEKDRLAKTHHEYMAGIANLISNCLYDWASANNKNITRAYCSNLAWAGLQETKTFEEKVKKKELNKAEIGRNLESEQENYTNSKGQACAD